VPPEPVLAPPVPVAPELPVPGPVVSNVLPPVPIPVPPPLPVTICGPEFRCARDDAGEREDQVNRLFFMFDLQRMGLRAVRERRGSGWCEREGR